MYIGLGSTGDNFHKLLPKEPVDPGRPTNKLETSTTMINAACLRYTQREPFRRNGGTITHSNKMEKTSWRE